MVDGKTTLDSRELFGKKVLVLRFQASYCKPCAKESPAFGRLYDKYRTKNVEVVALHVQDTPNDTRNFIRRNKVNYPVALDPIVSFPGHPPDANQQAARVSSRGPGSASNEAHLTS